MDVLVLWDGGTQNIVSSNDLKTVVKRSRFKVGSKVRMRWVNKCYYGIVLDMEKVAANSESSSDDDVVLSKIEEKIKNSKQIVQSLNPMK